MQQIPLTLLTRITPHLAQAINYPGEGQYLALVPGLQTELWFDDGNYTGLAKIPFHQLLTQADLTAYISYFQGRSGTSACWLLLDRANLNLFIGTNEAVSAYLQRNVHPCIHQGRENASWQDPSRY